MSLALRLYDPVDYETTQAFIYFDAVTDYTRTYRADTTKHPVDKDSPITDHYSVQNSEYNISGIISAADINIDGAGWKDLYDHPLDNYNEYPLATTIEGGEGNLLTKILPDFVGQFLGLGRPDVIVDTSSYRVDWSEDVRDLLLKAMRGVYWNERFERFETKPLYVEIYRMGRIGLPQEKIETSLVFTSIEESSTPQDNGAMFLEIKLEEVRTVSVRETEIPKNVTDSMQKKASPESNKGSKPAAKESVEVDDKGKAKSKEEGSSKNNTIAVKGVEGIFGAFKAASKILLP